MDKCPRSNTLATFCTCIGYICGCIICMLVISYMNYVDHGLSSAVTIYLAIIILWLMIFYYKHYFFSHTIIALTCCCGMIILMSFAFLTVPMLCFIILFIIIYYPLLFTTLLSNNNSSIVHPLLCVLFGLATVAIIFCASIIFTPTFFLLIMAIITLLCVLIKPLDRVTTSQSLASGPRSAASYS